MIDDSDGGAGWEAMTSWQPSAEIESDGIGDAVDVEMHPVAVKASMLMANQARRANTQGATVIGKG